MKDRLNFYFLVQEPSPVTISPICSNSTYIGPYCNISSNPCQTLRPCMNNATCINSNTTAGDYNCACPSGFNGTQCEFDHRPCKPDTCLNNGIYSLLSLSLQSKKILNMFLFFIGTCLDISDTAFVCSCEPGWEGIHCQRMVDYCKNVACKNGGFCCPLFLNYTCECVDESYSGRHCEIKVNQSLLISSSTIGTSFQTTDTKQSNTSFFTLISIDN
jgi:hypothetical protein